MSKSYTDLIGAASSTGRTASRIAGVAAALAPPPPPTPGAAMVPVAPQHQTESIGEFAWSVAPSVAGGAVGAYAWRRHRVLGFLAGSAVVSNASGLYSGGDARTHALHRLGIEGAGIVGALQSKRPLYQVGGWLAGTVLGMIASYYVPGSPVKAEWQAYEASRVKK
jgi:hypothetical protein